MLRVDDNIYAFKEVNCKQDFERGVTRIPQLETDVQLFLKEVLICFAHCPYSSVQFPN